MEEEYSKFGKKSFILMLSFSLMILGNLFYFVLLPKYKDVYEKKDSLEESKLKFDLVQEEAAKSKEFLDLKEETAKDYHLIERSLINDESLVFFIEDIESISTSIGAVLSKKYYKKPTKKKVESVLTEKTPEELALEQQEASIEKNTERLMLTLEGDYKQFLIFLYQLENLAYVFNVESVDVSSLNSLQFKKAENVPLNQIVANIIISFIKK